MAQGVLDVRGDVPVRMVLGVAVSGREPHPRTDLGDDAIDRSSSPSGSPCDPRDRRDRDWPRCSYRPAGPTCVRPRSDRPIWSRKWPGCTATSGSSADSRPGRSPDDFLPAAGETTGAGGDGRPRCPRGLDLLARVAVRDDMIGLVGPEVELANPQQSDETVLRRSLMPGLLGAPSATPTVARGTSGCSRSAWRSPTPTTPPQRSPIAAATARPAPGTFRPRGRWRPSCSRSRATTPAPRSRPGRSCATNFGWSTYTWSRRPRTSSGRGALAAAPGLHPSRSAWLVAGSAILGTVGEVDPSVLEAAGWGRGADQQDHRVGWLELDLNRLFDRDAVPRSAPTWPNQ